MYITRIPNRGSPPTILLRESYREGNKVKTRTLANLSKLPKEALDVLQRTLKGEVLVAPEKAFKIIASYHQGHVQAVLLAMQKINFESLIASRPSQNRNLVMAMVMSRILEPNSKLATTRWWHSTTLPSVLNVANANEDDLYDAMDRLLLQQDQIEKRLAARHLDNDCMALYDLSSSYFEGNSCPLAARGYNRDDKKGKLQVNYGLLTNRQGIPIAVSVFKGNTSDSKTLLSRIHKVQQNFGIKRFVLVGDRGMIAQKQIDALQNIDGIDWITALRSGTIEKLIRNGAVQKERFEDHNLFEFTHPDFPGERLIACHNPELAKRRAERRKSLLEATSKELQNVRQIVQQGRLCNKDNIDVCIHKVLKRYKIGKYYKPDIRADGFDFEVDQEKIAMEVAKKSKTADSGEKSLHMYRRHIKTISEQLERIRQRIKQGRVYGKDIIGVRVGKVLNKYKVGKHFKLEIHDDKFDFEIDQEKVNAEASLDGIYIVRTGLSKYLMNADDTVRSYKLLCRVERAFRSFKTIDLHVRPIRHRLENRVRAHIFICMLSYYVQWHMIEAWRPLLFCDEEQEAKTTRDPVAPAQRSKTALQKAHSKTLEDGSVVHSFQTLLKLLSGIFAQRLLYP